MFCRHENRVIIVDLYERGIGFYTHQKDVEVYECIKCKKIERITK